MIDYSKIINIAISANALKQAIWQQYALIGSSSFSEEVNDSIRDAIEKNKKELERLDLAIRKEAAQ